MFCLEMTIIFVCSSFSPRNNGKTQVSVFTLCNETTERLRLSSFLGETKSISGRRLKDEKIKICVFSVSPRKDEIKIQKISLFRGEKTIISNAAK